MRATDVMSKEIIAIPPEPTLEEAVELMIARQVSGLAVMDREGELVGILTESDLLRRIELGTEHKRPRWLEFFISPGRLADEYSHTRGRRVDEVMTPDVVSVSDGASLDEVVVLMRRHKIKRVPVTSGGVPIGMVTRADLMKMLAEQLQGRSSPARRDDAAILCDIEAEFTRLNFLSRNVTATVSNGEVYLDGSVADERERTALRVAAENVPGVTAVHDRLTCVDPMMAVGAF